MFSVFALMISYVQVAMCALCEVLSVWDGRHVFCVRLQTCLLRGTADMSTVRHCRDVCCVARHTYTLAEWN